mgnify:CR=1 FL=1
MISSRILVPSWDGLLKCIYRLWVFLYVSRVLTLLMVVAKGKFDYKFSSWWNLRSKFGKITSGFTFTEQWGAGNYPIVFWSVTSETEYSLYVVDLQNEMDCDSYQYADDTTFFVHSKPSVHRTELCLCFVGSRTWPHFMLGSTWWRAYSTLESQLRMYCVLPPSSVSDEAPSTLTKRMRRVCWKEICGIWRCC